MTLLLPDLSEFQANADLKGIKAANGGAVILRVAYGTSHPDKAFARHRASAQALGYQFCGLYQYLVAGQDAAAQARAFVKIVGHLYPHEVAILDLEEGPGNQAGRAGQWASVVDKAFGVASAPLNQRSWLYSGEFFAEEAGLAPIFASARHTWVAAYGSKEPTLGHTLWQCTDGQVGPNRTNWPGCGHCDTNIFHGTLGQLSALIKRG